MRTRLHTIVLRLGFTLAALVLGAFVALVAAVVVACVAILGGPWGWVAGLVLGAAVGQVARRRTGALMGRLVDAA
jgi:hypothetical protein